MIVPRVKRLGWTTLLVIVFFFLLLQIPDDPDLGINLGVGRFIIATKTVPRSDLFSFSLPDHPYVYHSWLGQLIITLVYDSQNTIQHSLIMLSIAWTLIATTAMYLLYRLCRRSFWSLCLLFLSATLVFSSLGVRPQMFTFLFLVLESHILLGWRQRKSAFYLLPLIPLFLLWANLHLGFVIGIGSMWFFIFVEQGRSMFSNTPRPQLRVFFSPFLVAIAATLATLLNPFGLKLYEQAYRISQNPYNLTANLEWAPLVSRGITHWLFAGIALLFFVLLARQKKVDWTLYCLSLILFWFTLRNTRTVVPFLVFFLPLVSHMLASLSPAWRVNWKSVRSNPSIVVAFVALLAALLLRTFTNTFIVSQSTSNPRILANRMSYPYGAVVFMKTTPLPTRLLNFYNWGGYLVWQIPQMRVFETGIMDTFQRGDRLFLDDYFSLVNAKPEWENLMEYYQIDSVLLPPELPLVQILKKESDWHIEYKDSTSILMRKK